MLLVKFMGFLDLFTAIVMVLYNYGLAPTRILFSIILYLILKGLMFKGDVASMLDFAIAGYLVLMIFHPITVITWISAIYILQKSFASIFM